MDFLNTTAAFIFVLGVIIFVHEFGHFITAKAFGMRVFVFSFGFGRRLLGFKWGDTDCRLSLVPLGGYVKLEGELDDKLSEDTSALGDGKDFLRRPRWQRSPMPRMPPRRCLPRTARRTMWCRCSWVLRHATSSRRASIR